MSIIYENYVRTYVSINAKISTTQEVMRGLNLIQGVKRRSIEGTYNKFHRKYWQIAQIEH